MAEPVRASPVLLEMARHLQAQPARKSDELFTAVLELVSSTLTDSARQPDTEVMRTLVCADWLVRSLAPKVLTRMKRGADAERMRGQKPLVSQRPAEAAAEVAHAISLGFDDKDKDGAPLMQAVEMAARAAARRDAVTGEAGRWVAAGWLAADRVAHGDNSARRALVADMVSLVTHLLQLK